MKKLLGEISACTTCKDFLPLGPRPVLAGSPTSKIAIVGQAPGSRVHVSGIPWDDKSGENLRTWLGVSDKQFYDKDLFAIVPMGFCYPGKGKSGDLPPRKECAPLWHKQLFDKMPLIELILLIGKYAQNYYLPQVKKRTLTETVKQFDYYLPKHFVLPHPSPRNNIWMKKNDWFKLDVIPRLQEKVLEILSENQY